MSEFYEYNRPMQQAELSFMDAVVRFRQRQVETYKGIRPPKIYGYIDGRLVHLETHRKIMAGMAAVALMAEIGYGFI